MKVKDIDVKDVGIDGGEVTLTLALTVGEGDTPTDKDVTAKAIVSVPLQALSVLFKLLKDRF